MMHKGFLVEKYCNYPNYKGWVNHKFVTTIRYAKTSITQAKKRHYNKDVNFRIIKLMSDNESI